ncbi:MAG: twin-arginine translocase subunit TatC [Thermodesulfobacteriota bacterium]
MEEHQDQDRMSLIDHLSELRGRLIRIVLAIAVGAVICFIFSQQIFEFAEAPVKKYLPEGSSMVTIRLQDPFFVYLKISFIAGFFLTIPYVLYQLWAFVKPGLFEREKRLAGPAIVLATGLFYLGGAFAYFVVIPAAFKFFITWPTDLKFMLSIREYVSLVVLLMLAFGAVFETPIVVVALGLFGLYDTTKLRKGRRYFVVIAFVIAAILTPTPDPLNQSLMAIPMMLLYEVGILILARFEKQRRHREEMEALADPKGD